VCLALLLSAGIYGSAQAQQATTAALVGALQQKKYDEAVKISAALVKTTPASAKLWTLRAVALEHTGQVKEAQRAYLRALQADAKYLPALEGAAQLAYESHSDGADALLARIVALQPANETAHAMLGALAYRKGEFAKAVEEFSLAQNAIRARPEAQMEYALSLVHLDRQAEAVTLLQQVVSADGSNADARYDLALLEWRGGAAGDALATLEPLVSAEAKDTQALRLAAAIREQNHETPQAVELLRMAIMVNPDEVDNYVDFATLAFAHNSFDVGVDIVSRGLTRIPNAAALYMARGVLYGQNGSYEKAMDDFERARQLDPENAMSATAEGVAQSQHQNHEAALENFRRQVKEHPKDALGYYLLAEALSWSPPEAKDRAGAANSLVEAIGTAEKATQLDPQLVQAWELLASLYLQNDRMADAVKASRTALALAPKDQQALYTLILALRKTGSKDELKELVQKLTELRKDEQAANSQGNHYGRLVEAP
jgi:tetratricopeptide (TPR) repeat protein